MINWLIMKIPSVRRLQAALEEKTQKLHETREACRREMAKNEKRPARMVVDAGMSGESIKAILGGTSTSPIMRAVCALINERIVSLADAATDRPRDTMQLADRTVPGYSSEERIHDAGGVSHLAELLALLQDLSKAKDDSAVEVEA